MLRALVVVGANEVVGVTAVLADVGSARAALTLSLMLVKIASRSSRRSFVVVVACADDSVMLVAMTVLCVGCLNSSFAFPYLRGLP